MSETSCQPLQIIEAQTVTDGAGVQLQRSLGLPEREDFDPFLLLDEIRSDRPADYIEGFPPHPHRGFQTITIMRHGGFRHRDSLGNEGAIGSGGVQWMKAGGGIVHEEMPAPEEGRLWGYQLWFNLPAAHKMDAPEWRDIPAADIPQLPLEGGGRLRLIAGRFRDHEGPLDKAGQELFLTDVSLPAGARLDLPLGHTRHHALLHVGEGRLQLDDGTILRTGQLALFRHCPRLAGTALEDAMLLIAAARPIGEPIARGGPFVMNYPQELRQAVEDWRTGRMGQIA
ncbi:MAG: pirin family protein [Gammaproteobacteria bacterium]|nr:MAG: pirin family protein [Gammaproteobacteria bacterium]